MMTNEERKQKVREAGERRVSIATAMLSAHAGKNAAQLGEHFADDAESTWVDHLPAVTAKGRQPVLELWQPLWKAVPDLAARPALILANENHVVAFATLSGKQGRELTVGAAFSLYFADWEKADHRVRCEEIFFDQATLDGRSGAPAPNRGAAAMGSIGATPASHVSSDADAERIHLAVVNAMNTGLKIRELDGPLAHYADDAVLRNLSEAGDHAGKAAIRKSLEDRFAMSSDAKLERIYAWCADRWVVAEYRWAGTNDGPLPGGKPASGKPFALRELHLFEIVGDKIKQQWIFGQSVERAVTSG